jgi:flagellar biosynthesis protein FlhG
LHLNASAEKIIVVTTPEPHAMTDAYALIKVLAEEHKRRHFHLLVNLARTSEEGGKIAARISEVAKRFLDVTVNYVGHVPPDPQVQQSIMKRRAASEQTTYTVAGQAWNEIARKIILGAPAQENATGKIQQFWENLFMTTSPEQRSFSASI